jgi:hypothetical protein
MAHDYISKNDAEFLSWAKNLYNVAITNYTKWAIPSPQLSLKQPLDNFEAAFEKIQEPNSGKVDMERKKETRKICEKAFRVYVSAYLQPNPTVTDDERVALGIPIHKTGKSPIPPTDSVPELEVDTGIPRTHRVYYREKGSKRRGKPEHVKGIEIRWAMLDHYPQSIEELIHSDFDTASPWEKTFDESDRGKRVYYCGRWEMPSEGIKCPFGEIVEAIIA